MPLAVIVSQGDEVVSGQTIDTNAAWLATRLTELGVQVVQHITVGDATEAIGDALSRATEVGSVVLCTGGLGPTQDDLTADACAAAFGRPLALDTVALAHIEALFARFGRPMAPSNRKQAMLPQGALRLDNAFGTAPGFTFEAGRALVVCMPGVPREMRPMFEHAVAPRLTERFALAPPRMVTLRTTGVGESTLQDRIGHFEHPDAVLSYRTSLGENQLKLRFRAGTPEATVRSMVADLHERVGSPVFSIDGLDGPGHDLATTLGQLMTEGGHTLATAESCSGGRIAALCTGVPGASAWFEDGVVAYANATKERALGVPASTIAAHGAVSEPVARAMATGARERAGTTFALSSTGVAGPGGGTTDKPVGTVHLALATPAGVVHRMLSLGADRHRVQMLTAHAALDLLRRHLTGLLPD